MFTNRQRKIIHATLDEAQGITQGQATRAVKAVRGDYPADKITTSRSEVTVWFDDDTEDTGQALAKKIAKKLGATNITTQHNRAIIHFTQPADMGDPLDKGSRWNY